MLKLSFVLLLFLSQACTHAQLIDKKQDEKIVITGGAGFIGSHVAQALLARGDSVVIIDCLSDYYNPELKHNNLAAIKNHDSHNRLRFYQTDISDLQALEDIFKREQPTVICHLAACAGVGYSLLHPIKYLQTNVIGTCNIFEMAKKFGIKHVVFASSSSVYGDSSIAPFKETEIADKPYSPYAASKRAGELLAYTYHHLYGISCNCLRFFTVYGPHGRPDMAPFKFLDAIYHQKQITQYGDGSCMRDFTYIDDIVDGVVRAIDKRFTFEIFNLGNSNPITLRDFIKTIESIVGKQAHIVQQERQAGDVFLTYADITKAQTMLGFNPKVSLREGIERMFIWYQQGHSNV